MSSEAYLVTVTEVLRSRGDLDRRLPSVERAVGPPFLRLHAACDDG